MTQGELEKIPQKVIDSISTLELRIMTDIVSRVKENGFLSASDRWQISRLQQLSEADDQIREWIQDFLQVADEAMEEIISEDVYQEYYSHAPAYNLSRTKQIPFSENEALQQTIEAVKRQTQETFENLTGSMGFAQKNPATGKLEYSELGEFYRDTLDNAMYDIHSGAFDYNTVLNRTIKQMTDSGIRWVNYESGHRDRVDVAARRAIMTGFRQIQGQINDQVAEELHTDFFEVTAHVGARPTHQPWQGRVYSRQELIDVCGLGDVTGLKGINCYHDYRPFIPGVSTRTYTDEQLEEMIRDENTPKEYNGKQYTTYEALQQQRAMERAMRKTRQDIQLLKEGGASDQEIMLRKAKYQGQYQTYKDFSEKMDLPTQMDRVYQDGLTGNFNLTKKETKALEEMKSSGSDSSKMAKLDSGSTWPASGKKITNEEFTELNSYAEERGISLGGFKNFDGDVSLVKDMIDDVNDTAVRFNYTGGKIRIENSFSMDDNDFASTRNQTIYINNNAFRSREVLEAEYAKLAEDGYFVKGTTYRSIAYHEMGHVLTKVYQIPYAKIWKKCSRAEILEELSIYANTDSRELIAEVISACMSLKNPPALALKILNMCDILK